MKKIILAFIVILLLSFSNVSAEDFEFTQDNAINFLHNAQYFVNQGDVDAIVEKLSPDANPEIKEGIISNIKGKEIKFYQELKDFEVLENGNIKINARYSAEGLNWSVSGFSNYYVLDIVDDDIVIVDTNFYKFTPEFLSALGPILPFIFIFGFIFFIWMLNDCIKREIENKFVWILLILFVPLGSFIYFFTGRKKYPLKEEYQKIKKS